MTKTKTNKASRTLFGARFSNELNKWKEKAPKGQRRTNTTFAKLVSSTTTRGSVEKWCRGENIPQEDTLKKICKIFGVSEDFFDPENATHDELYQNEANFIKGIGKQHVEFSKLIDLDLDLIRALANRVDFDKQFPLYAPIKYKDGVCSRNVNYSDSAHIEDVAANLRFLQVEREGKRITLHRCDLAFLKEVQDKVVEYMEFLLYQRTKEMEEEVLKDSQDLLEVTVDGKPVTDPKEREKYLKMMSEPPEAVTIEEYEKKRHERSGDDDQGENICVIHKDRSPDFVREHDRFAKDYYLFKGEPEPDWFSIYRHNPEWTVEYKQETKYRRATQEDFDRFFSPQDGERVIEKPDGGIQIVKEGK